MHAFLAPAQPWYSLGFVCLVGSLFAHVLASARPTPVTYVHDFLAGLLLGLGMVFVAAALWLKRQAETAANDDA